MNEEEAIYPPIPEPFLESGYREHIEGTVRRYFYFPSGFSPACISYRTAYIGFAQNLKVQFWRTPAVSIPPPP